MKQIHFLFCVLLLSWLSGNNLAHGQIFPTEWEARKMRDDIPRNAPLVFDGQLINRHIEYICKDGKVYFSYLVKVEKVLRGNIQLGLVELKTWSHHSVDSTGRITSEKAPMDGANTDLPHSKERVTFFCNWTDENNVILDTEKKNVKQIAFYNDLVGYIVHQEFPHRYKGMAHTWRALKGFQTDGDYQDFLAKYGLGEPRTPIESPQKKSPNNQMSKNKNTKTIASNLLLDFVNAQTSVVGNVIYFEFDIRGKAQPLGSSAEGYLDSLQLNINYNSAAFGSFLGTSGGATITSLIPAANATSYQSIQLLDVTSSILRFKLNAKSFADSTLYNRYKIPTSNFTRLFHIKFKLLDCQATKGIDWSPDTWIGGTHNWSNWISFKPHPKSHRSLTYSEDYTPLMYGGNLLNAHPNICTGENIVTFFPATIRAGFGDTLTIVGTGGRFGYNINKKGYVRFKDANAVTSNSGTGEGEYDLTKGLDPEDIIRWRPDTIKVKVPSYIRRGHEGSKYGIPGSGEIYIDTINGLGNAMEIGFSLQNLHIPYASWSHAENSNLVLAVGDTIAMEKHRYWLFNRNCQKNYHVKVDNSLIQYFPGVNIIAVVQQAIQDWNTKLGYTALVYDANGDNVIRYNSTNIGNTLMNTARKSSIPRLAYSTRPDTALTNAGFDINVFNWNWNTTLTGALDSTHLDFYTALLHELGHGLGLDHCINYEAASFPATSAMEVMHGSSARRQTPRINLNTGGGDTALGGKDILDQSIAPALIWVGLNDYGKLNAPIIDAVNVLPASRDICGYGNTKNVSITLTPTSLAPNAIYTWTYGAEQLIFNNVTFAGQGTPSLTLKHNPPTTVGYKDVNNMVVRCTTEIAGCKVISANTTFKASNNVVLTPTPSQCGNNATWTIPIPTPPNGTFTAYKTTTPATAITGIVQSTSATAITLNRTKFPTAGTYKIVYNNNSTVCPIAKDSTFMTTFANCATLNSTVHKIYINEICRNATAYRNENTIANDPCNTMKLYFTGLGAYNVGDSLIAKLSDATGAIDTLPANINKRIVGRYGFAAAVSAGVTGKSDSIKLENIARLIATASPNYKIRLYLKRLGTTPLTEWGEVYTEKINFALNTCASNGSGPCPSCGNGGRAAPTHFTPEEIQLYPNPTTDHFTLNTPDYEAATEVNIVNTQGQIIDKRSIFGTTNEIETHELPIGLYFVRVAQGERSTVLKLVIVR